MMRQFLHTSVTAAVATPHHSTSPSPPMALWGALPSPAASVAMLEPAVCAMVSLALARAYLRDLLSVVLILFQIAATNEFQVWGRALPLPRAGEQTPLPSLGRPENCSAGGGGG